ncbi:MAG: TetR/AcrR family transcriptional regulator [Bacteroidia bacterium]|nr:TetR/AcrR family transcriptional regulator [Bacteroidia bacterium]
MKTRDKILLTARQLFNQDGLSEVSSRNVSDQLGISYGNLCYHFPKKDDLVLSLYHEMQQKLDTEVARLQSEILGFDFMVHSLRGMLETYDEYRFVYLDLPQLIRRFPEIREHSRTQYRNRVKICRDIYGFLIMGGYLRPEHFDGHYDLLAQNMLMILNHWVVDAAIYYEGPAEKRVDHYLALIYRFVSASLTRKGADAFIRVYEQVGKVSD